MEDNMRTNLVALWAAIVLAGIQAHRCYGQDRPADRPVAIIDRGRSGPVRALFDLGGVETAPFPSDQFTVPDGDQITGRRINLPAPDCSVRPSDCEDIAAINGLDGF